MKKIFIIIIIILVTFISVNSVNAVSEKTSLKDLKEKLKKDEKELNTVIDKQNKTKNNIKSIERDLGKIEKQITDYELSIE